MTVVIMQMNVNRIRIKTHELDDKKYDNDESYNYIVTMLIIMIQMIMMAMQDQ